MGAKERKQLMGLLIALPLLGIGAFYMYVYSRQTKATASARHTVDSLQTQVDQAKRDLRHGTVEALKARIAQYEASLRVMRRLVPTDAEVANLLDDISNKAKLRNVSIGTFSPMSMQSAGRFQVARYKLDVVGHYDDIGGFLSDIAALPRIMVPIQLSLKPVPEASAKRMSDTTGALLDAAFELRTFVKSATDTADTGGTGGAQ